MTEVFVEHEGRKIWCGIEGAPRARPPLVCIPGGPGISHHYMTTLGPLSAERQVIYYDALGAGRSDRPDIAWTIDVFEREIDAVVRGLGLESFHLFAHSAAGFAAMPFAARRPAGLRALILSGTVANVPSHMEHVRVLLAKTSIEGERLVRFERAENNPKERDVWHLQVVNSFMALYSCRLRPLPEILVESTRQMNRAALQALKGGWVLFTTELASWNFTDRLPEISAPTLFTYGRHDVLSPESCAVMQRIPDCESHMFENSSHIPHLEEPAVHCTRVAAFLAKHD